jgi:hypothetical protein
MHQRTLLASRYSCRRRHAHITDYANSHSGARAPVTNAISLISQLDFMSAQTPVFDADWDSSPLQGRFSASAHSRTYSLLDMIHAYSARFARAAAHAIISMAIY